MKIASLFFVALMGIRQATADQFQGRFLTMLEDPTCDGTMEHTKCGHKNDARIWKKTGMTVEECQAACEAEEKCTFYSHMEIGKHAGDCMACLGNSDAETDEHTDFTLYPVDCKPWDSEKTVIEDGDAVPADYGACPTMYKDYKCPWQHEDRTHRIEDLTIQECYEQCIKEPRCKHWSYSREGDADGKYANVCMGCDATVNKHVHKGFNLYSMCDEAREPTDPPAGEPTDPPAAEPNPSPVQSPTPNPPTYISGDPHIKKFNGDSYDFHGGCDLVLLSNPDFNNGQGMQIHVRTRITRWWSAIESAAVRIGEDTFEVKAGIDDRPYWFNGEQGRMRTSGILPVTVGGFVVRFRQPKDNIIQYKILLDDDQYMIIRSVKDILRVELDDTMEKDFGSSRGLMGHFRTGDLVGRDGKTNFEDTDEFGMHWQVRDSDPILFHTTKAPQFPEECAMPINAEENGRISRHLRASSITHKEAEKACSNVDKSDFKNCVFDVVALDDLGAADGY